MPRPPLSARGPSGPLSRYSTVVTVTDSGPYVAGRELDLSAVAAEEIGLTYTGTD